MIVTQLTAGRRARPAGLSIQEMKPKRTEQVVGIVIGSLLLFFSPTIAGIGAGFYISNLGMSRLDHAEHARHAILYAAGAGGAFSILGLVILVISIISFVRIGRTVQKP